ncbi:hypothetical protein CYMTET_48469 [Cymbomonas tetramitiformis]|uniref:Uncharacterized protein n=1 Tax=Cymbomonas tetramitiformis TaxID=36881 RepID=A0AAE0BTF9_9CHLO|nr:hypothetical protein CYMTET_48469 [Cymbomonas tetramitiformis]
MRAHTQGSMGCVRTVTTEEMVAAGCVCADILENARTMDAGQFPAMEDLPNNAQMGVAGMRINTGDISSVQESEGETRKLGRSTATIHNTQYPDDDSEESYARGREDVTTAQLGHEAWWTSARDIISDAVTVAKLQQSQSENVVSAGSVRPLKETAHSEKQLEEKPVVDAAGTGTAMLEGSQEVRFRRVARGEASDRRYSRLLGGTTGGGVRSGTTGCSLD